MQKGQRQELRFVCREYRGLEVLCAWIAKGGNTLLGLRGEALSRLRAAAIAQLNVVATFSTGYFLSQKAQEPKAFMGTRVQPSETLTQQLHIQGSILQIDTV